MASNFPGPYELRIKYTETALSSPLIQHIAKMNIALVETAVQGDIFDNYDIKDIDGDTTIALDVVVEAWLVVFLVGFATGTNIDSVELWKYPTAQSFDAVFWSAYTPTANVGTSGGATQASIANIYTFRSQEGGILKLSPMEGVQPAGIPEAYAGMETYQTNIVDFILDGDGSTFSAPFLARDTSYPFAFNRMFPGQNEHLWGVRNGR